jgi:hypothetical protein
VSTSPLDPQDIRAAAEIHRELGPEYSDAVIAAFIDRVDQAVAARVEARLAEERQRHLAPRGSQRRTLVKGVALGVCAGALVAGAAISHANAVNARQGQSQIVVPKGPGPGHRIFIPGPREIKPNFRVIKPVIPPPPGA